jgi:hypothetical protein
VSRPLLQNVILTLGFVAFVAGAVRATVAFPAVMHAVGVQASHTAEEVLLETLEATGQ